MVLVSSTYVLCFIITFIVLLINIIELQMLLFFLNLCISWWFFCQLLNGLCPGTFLHYFFIWINSLVKCFDCANIFDHKDQEIRVRVVQQNVSFLSWRSPPWQGHGGKAACIRTTISHAFSEYIHKIENGESLKITNRWPTELL